VSSPTPPNGSIRTAAIMLLFRDGFHVEDLAEIFTLSPFNIEEHLRLAMFNGQAAPAARVISAVPSSKEGVPSAPKKNQRQPKAKRSLTRSCEKHPAAEFGAKGQCKACAREYAKDWYQKQQQKKRKSGQNSEPEKSEPVSTKSRTPKKPLTQADVNRSPVTEADQQPVRQADLRSDTTGEMEDVFQKIATRSTTEATQPQAADTTEGKSYSHLIQCPKCGQRHRFWKRANADDSRDHWISMACNNSLKISHYQIKTDRNYRGEAA
jgi:hypothetical protein